MSVWLQYLANNYCTILGSYWIDVNYIESCLFGLRRNYGYQHSSMQAMFIMLCETYAWLWYLLFCFALQGKQ